MAETNIPNFSFSGFYYFEILNDILRYLRINTPEITDESDEEPYIQLARAWALAHHYMNVRMDMVANEAQLPTARLLESVRTMLKLINYTLAQATPSATELVMEFSSLFTEDESQNIVPKNSQFGTEDTEDSDQIIFEAVTDNYISRTDKLTNVFIKSAINITLSNKSGTLFDYSAALAPQEGDIIIQNGNYAIISEVIDGDTIRLNTASLINNGTANLVTANFSADKAGEAFTDGLIFDFGEKVGDELYLIHDSVMWDRLDFLIAQIYKTGIKGVWEFYDGSKEDVNPDAVTNLGSNLKFDLTSLLGTENKSGTVVYLSYAPSATGEFVVSEYSSGKNIAKSTGLLGQITPSIIATDYIAGTVWQPIDILENTSKVDGEFSQDGYLQFNLPQTLKQNWTKTTINGKTGFALRFRIQAFENQAASVIGTAFNSGGLDSNNYKMLLGFDGFADTEIDVTGNAGATPGAYLLANIITNINNAMTIVDSSLAGVASSVNGKLKLTAPNSLLGKDSQIRILAPSGQDATNEVLGFSEVGYPYEYSGIGGKAVIDNCKIDQGKQYLLFNISQGQTVVENPLASSDGSPSQEFVLGFKPLIDDSLLIEVDEGSGFTSYDKLENFLNADGSRRAFTQEIDADDKATIEFGDGVNGKIPPAGIDNIRATYKVGADQNGNVGANTIISNLAGISFVNRVFNPRQATGWAEKQGNSEESLEKAKIAGPASLRTLGKAITPSDCETLSIDFTSPTTGSKPVARAKAIEETFGIKTIELVVVGNGGGILNETQKTELAEYFNGSKPKDIDGVLVSNHELTPVNYTPKPIDVTVVVEGGNRESIINALTALLNPNALFSDGVTYRWNFEGTVPTSLIIAEIHATDPVAVKKVTMTSPSADIVLGTRELPTVGNLSVTVI